MKKLVFAAALCAAAVAFGDECATEKCEQAVAAPDAAQAVAPVAKPAPKTPEQRKAEMKAWRAQHKAKMEERDRKAAEKQGITVEELHAQRKAKGEERAAKRLGLTPEEFRKLTPEERKAKYAEMRQKKVDEHKAMMEKKAAEAPKAPEAKSDKE